MGGFKYISVVLATYTRIRKYIHACMRAQMHAQMHAHMRDMHTCLHMYGTELTEQSRAEHYMILHDMTVHYTTLHYSTAQYITPHRITSQYIAYTNQRLIIEYYLHNIIHLFFFHT